MLGLYELDGYIIMKSVKTNQNVGSISLVVLYLLGFTAAELIIVFLNPIGGLLTHVVLLIFLLVHASMMWEDPLHEILLCLAFAPLIRIMSLSIPLMDFPQQYWYLLTSVPLFATAVVAARMLGYSAEEIGLNLRNIPLQLMVGLTGIILGFIEYRLLEPEPLVDKLTLAKIWAPALILFVGTGLLEELIFRGLLQKASVAALGRSGPLYVSVLFAILHIGWQSSFDLVFVFLVALVFSWIVSHSGSIVGVTISHGLTNITLFLIAPFVMSIASPAPTPIAESVPPDTQEVLQLPPLPTEPRPGSGVDPLTMIIVVAPDEVDSANTAAEGIVNSLSVTKPDLHIDIHAISDYGEAFQLLCAGDAEVVTLDAFGVNAAHDFSCGRVIYVLENDGEVFTQSQLIANANSTLLSVFDLAAQDFCRTDPHSLTGWIVPSLRLKQAGVDPQSQLATIIDVETDEQVVRSIVDLRCDAGATLVGAQENVQGIIPAQIWVIEELLPVPNDSLVLAANLSPEVNALLQEVLESFRDEIASAHNADGLQPADDDMYHALGGLISEAGLNLESLAK